eukprot:TRINITY_DN522_c0_g1_i3.p1 TRINITY_DN522_c0_g1~~TRINITY_DN522_c0_g1_i3.p1  ORF type:complete len:512 (-),score=165.14 TRINITY_DN522_c0_g1_i3:94-1545(-)
MAAPVLTVKRYEKDPKGVGPMGVSRYIFVLSYNGEFENKFRYNEILKFREVLLGIEPETMNLIFPPKLSGMDWLNNTKTETLNDRKNAFESWGNETLKYESVYNSWLEWMKAGAGATSPRVDAVSPRDDDVVREGGAVAPDSAAVTADSAEDSAKASAKEKKKAEMRARAQASKVQKFSHQKQGQLRKQLVEKHKAINMHLQEEKTGGRWTTEEYLEVCEKITDLNTEYMDQIQKSTFKDIESTWPEWSNDEVAAIMEKNAETAKVKAAEAKEKRQNEPMVKHKQFSHQKQGQLRTALTLKLKAITEYVASQQASGNFSVEEAREHSEKLSEMFDGYNQEILKGSYQGIEGTYPEWSNDEVAAIMEKNAEIAKVKAAEAKEKRQNEPMVKHKAFSHQKQGQLRKALTHKQKAIIEFLLVEQTAGKRTTEEYKQITEKLSESFDEYNTQIMKGSYQGIETTYPEYDGNDAINDIMEKNEEKCTL